LSIFRNIMRKNVKISQDFVLCNINKNNTKNSLKIYIENFAEILDFALYIYYYCPCVTAINDMR